MLRTLLAINKAGGLILHQDFVRARPGAASGNEMLMLASTFHSLHAIASQVSPAPGCRGIEHMRTATFELQCMTTPTGGCGGRRGRSARPHGRPVAGIKFVLIADRGAQRLGDTLRRIYALYSDYVMKVGGAARRRRHSPLTARARPQNPFYEMDMPIRCSRFDAAVSALISAHNSRAAMH